MKLNFWQIVGIVLVVVAGGYLLMREFKPTPGSGGGHVPDKTPATQSP